MTEVVVHRAQAPIVVAVGDPVLIRIFDLRETAFAVEGLVRAPLVRWIPSLVVVTVCAPKACCGRCLSPASSAGPFRSRRACPILRAVRSNRASASRETTPLRRPVSLRRRRSSRRTCPPRRRSDDPGRVKTFRAAAILVHREARVARYRVIRLERGAPAPAEDAIESRLAVVDALDLQLEAAREENIGIAPDRS